MTPAGIKPATFRFDLYLYCLYHLVSLMVNRFKAHPSATRFLNNTHESTWNRNLKQISSSFQNGTFCTPATMIIAPWVSLQGYVSGNSVDDVKVFVLQTANLRVTVITSIRCHLHYANRIYVFLISNFRRVLNLLCILLGISPASDYCMLTFRNTLSVPSS